MKVKKVFTALLGLTLFAGLLAIQAHAQTSNKRTTITFNQPVQIPGKTLPAGTYTFTIPDTTGMRHIVQIWDKDKTNLIATVLAIPNYRLEAQEDTVIEFSERPANVPQAIKAWFYPGHAYGIEFVYPRQEAIQIAKAANEVVPAETYLPTPNTLMTVPLIAITPQQTEEPVTEAFQTTPTAAEPVETAQALPKTASLIPLFGLLGAMFILIAISVKRFV
jgi:hypothetical protein